ncbi:hypothetical protein OSC27_11505 [Microbacterium sp. STN6]|uniref:hypothetical protein n=1 Tax=Microbacterium sp. STN6 TaxID=2995588 RepID=UPI002260DA06|nr:hypothetical protein [Microbacterium sp. STN6]MCX7522900.1 hypothetical protein [Microbacterium sp. STN6]
MNEPGKRLSERTVLEEVLVSMLDDWASLGWVTSIVADSGIEGRQDRRTMSLGIVAQLLHRDLAVAGSYESSAGFVPWACSTHEALARVVTEWFAAGLNNGDDGPWGSIWLDATGAGDAIAHAALLREKQGIAGSPGDALPTDDSREGSTGSAYGQRTVVEELLVGMLIDWASLGWVESHAVGLGIASREDGRTMSLGIITEFLYRDLAVAGGLEDDGRFYSWQATADDTMARIVREWFEVGLDWRTNDFRDTIWFSSTEAGDAIARAVLEREERQEK